MGEPIKVAIAELKKRSRDTQRRRWALIVKSELDLDEGGIDETMKRPDLEGLFHEHYEAWQSHTDSFEEYDDLCGRENALDEAIDVLQEIVDHGIHAFSPDHPRFNKEPTP